MATMRRLAVAAGAWLLVAALAAPAGADGLAKFKELIEAKLPPGTLEYKDAKALGDNGFMLSGVTVTPPQDAGSKPAKIKAITVDDADFAALEKETPPSFVKMRVEGIEIPADATEGVNLKELAGIDKLIADLQLDYRLDADKKTFTLSRLELDLNGLARLELSMTLDNISLDDVNQPDKAMSDTTLRTASLVYDDRSLLAKALPAAAKQQGMDAAAVIAMAKGMAGGVTAQGGPATQAVFDALISFLEDYEKPKGPLRLTFSPPEKTTAEAITNAKNPDEVIKALGLTVSYAGTRKQHAEAAPDRTR
jgi:hypothetical protein